MKYKKLFLFSTILLFLAECKSPETKTIETTFASFYKTKLPTQTKELEKQ